MSEFPAPSINVYVTVVGPNWNVLPGWCDTVLCSRVSMLSVAIGAVHVAVACVVPVGATTVWLAGQSVITGFVVSSGIATK